jgi:hypothetical protein
MITSPPTPSPFHGEGDKGGEVEKRRPLFLNLFFALKRLVFDKLYVFVTD